MIRLIWSLILVLPLYAQENYVRQDALVLKAAWFAPLDTVTMAQFWHTTALRSEAMYNGDGSWGLGYADWPTQPYDSDHPLVRVVARHVLGLLSLAEAGLTDSTTMKRIRTGLFWLGERQKKEGAWPLYTNRRGKITTQSLLPTALAGRAMSRAFRVTGNPRYLFAAEKALNWQAVRPGAHSPYEQALRLGHLLEHYLTVHDQTYIETGVELAREIIARQLPGGSWQERGPLTSDEHALVTEALFNLERVLVQEHPFRRRLTAAATAALNYLLERQDSRGHFRALENEILADKVPALEVLALIAARRTRELTELDQPITGAVRALNTHESSLGVLWRGTQDRRFWAMAEALVWFTRYPPEVPEPVAIPDTAAQPIQTILPGSFQKP